MLRGAASVARTRGEARQSRFAGLAFPGTATARSFRPPRQRRHGVARCIEDVRVARRRFGVKLTGCGAATTLKSG